MKGEMKEEIHKLHGIGKIRGGIGEGGVIQIMRYFF